MSGRRAPLLVYLLSSFLLLSSVLYLAAYGRLPSDGTLIEMAALPSQPGLIVRNIRGESELETGDLVVAVNSQPLDIWMSQALWPPWPAPAPAAALEYTVVRGGQALIVRQALRPPPVSTVLAENWTIFFFLVYLLAIGFFVFAKRPHDLSARMLLLFTSSLFTSSAVFFVGLPLSGLQYGWLVWLWVWGAIVVYGFLAGTGLYFTTIFPQPWPEIKGRPAWAGLLYAGVWVPLLAHLLWGWADAAGPSARLLLAVRASSTMSVVAFPLAVLGSVVSYRLTRGDVQRRQVRWILWALMVGILPWAALTALPQALGLPVILPPLVTGLLWCALPTAFAISILREGLFDIDVIINRSLVYGGLTLMLAAAYFSGVVALQSLFRTLTGQQQSQLATVLSTLIIAALFSPLRQRLQRAVDRRFFRRKYDAARTLAVFGATLRDEVDLNALTLRLVAAVSDTMEPAQAWLWLRPAAPEKPRTPAPVRQ